MTAQNIFLVLMCKTPDLVHGNLVWTASLALRSLCELSIPFRRCWFEWSHHLKIDDKNGKMSVGLPYTRAKLQVWTTSLEDHTQSWRVSFLFLLQCSKQNPVILYHKRVVTTTFAAFSGTGVQNVASPCTIGVQPDGDKKQHVRPRQVQIRMYPSWNQPVFLCSF